jgi:Fur family ferric uptake transcriptional regulator
MTRPGLGGIVRGLSARGLRVTGGRLAVLSQVADMPGQFAAEEVVQRLPAVGRATVFRTLKLLVEMEVLCRVLMDDGTLRYRWSPPGHHHHLVCTSCGVVEDFTDCDVSDLIADLVERTGYRVQGHWLELYGRCATCAATGEADRIVAEARRGGRRSSHDRQHDGEERP